MKEEEPKGVVGQCLTNESRDVNGDRILDFPRELPLGDGSIEVSTST